MIEQLIKKNPTGEYDNVMPKSWIGAITDKSTGQSLVEILQGFNMYFLSYNGDTVATRCLVPDILRKKGLWITYVKYDGNVYVEYYVADKLDDKSWGDSSNWRIGNNTLVGDITISANGNWVVNGTELEAKAIGEKGNTPILRVYDNKLQVSYNLGETYLNVTDNPVYTNFRWSSESAEHSNIGRIQASTDGGKTWINMSNDFTNNLHISKYIGADEPLPTEGIAEGTVYAKGPTYAADDTAHSKPIYRLWVYAWKNDVLGWQDNGEFTSIQAGIVQETGDREDMVMSQKAVTDTLNNWSLQELGNDTVHPVSQKVVTDNNIILLQNLPFVEKGIYFNNFGRIQPYSKSKMILLWIPTKPCTFHGLWNFADEGSGITFLNEEFEVVGHLYTHLDGDNVSFSYNPSRVEVPEKAKYIAIHTQSDRFRVETSEPLMCVPYTIQKAIRDNSKAISSIFVEKNYASKAIRELYIHGDISEDMLPASIRVFNNDGTVKGYTIKFGTLDEGFYIETARHGYNKDIYNVPNSSGKKVIIESIVDFTEVPHWNDSSYTKILPQAYDIDFSPSIKTFAIKDSIEVIKNDVNIVKKDVDDIISIKCSKNLFNKEEIIEGYYIHYGSGVLVKHPTSAVSPLIPITPGEIYYISRPTIPGQPKLATTEVRFIDNNGNPLKPLQLNGAEFPNGYFVNGLDIAVKTPENALYLQFIVAFNGTKCDYDKTQVEKGSVYTYYVPYERRKIVDYPNLPSDLNGLSDKVDLLVESSNVEEITIANSDKIGFFSNSFLNGYCMLGKHAINNLSMFSDYIMYNFGHSGDDLLETLNRVNNNEMWLGPVPVQDWGIKYGVIAMQDNDGALYSMSSDTYYENGKKLANAIKAMGGIPILSTEHDSNEYYYNFSRLAKDYNIMFMDWGITASKLFNTYFTPFWYNRHPATRTAWMWTYGMKSYLDTLPRPNKAIKIFKARPGVSKSDCMYDDIVSRAERFEEITCGVMALNENSDKYFDRLDTNNADYQIYEDQYQNLQITKNSVKGQNLLLVECITPYDRNGISSLIAKVKVERVSNVYVKKITSLENPLPSQRYIAFGITAGTLSPGQSFEITGGVFNNNLLGTYIVEDVINDIVVTKTLSTGKTTSGTDNPTTNISGIVLKGSYDYPSANYIKRYNQPLGEWVRVELQEDGTIDLTEHLSTCMDFDKVSLLFEGLGIEDSGIVLSDIKFIVSGSCKKQNISSAKLLTPKEGISLLAKETFDSEDTEWEGITLLSKYTPVQSTVTNTKESLPAGINTVRIINKGNNVRQKLLVNELQSLDYHHSTIQIRIIARYFPKYIDIDSKWDTSSIKRGSYDCGNLVVYMASTKLDSNPVKVGVITVGAWWNEFIIETPYFNGKYIILKSEKDDLQIAKCSVVGLMSGNKIDTINWWDEF